MRYSWVYPKSTQDEVQINCIGSRAIPHSTSYRRSGLTSFRQLQRYPETPISSLEDLQFQHSNSRKAPCTPNHLERRVDFLASTEEVCHFRQAPQEEASLRNRYVRGTLNLLPQVEWTPRCPDSNEGRISLQWLECRIIFHLTG